MRAIFFAAACMACGRVAFDERTRPIAHVAPAAWTGFGALELSSGTIDTDALSLGTVTGDGALAAMPQLGGGPELAVLEAESIVLPAGVTVHAIGARPLILAAVDAIAISGTLDVGGTAAQPGAGADSDPTVMGQTPVLPTDVCDPGGGGGGAATAGASGGDTFDCGDGMTGGAGGPAIGDPALAILVGGGAGGNGISLDCPNAPGGGGGGAIQLTAGTVSISGAVLAGGGGGPGGIQCADPPNDDAGAGAGGGAGGSIYLDVDFAAISGLALANGGGGGGGGNGNGSNGPVGTGGAGQDARSTTPASGGAAQAGTSANGGTGGTGESPPTMPAATAFNGGGGGGAVGRIAITGSATITGTVSPAPYFE